MGASAGIAAGRSGAPACPPPPRGLRFPARSGSVPTGRRPPWLGRAVRDCARPAPRLGRQARRNFIRDRAAWRLIGAGSKSGAGGASFA